MDAPQPSASLGSARRRPPDAASDASGSGRAAWTRAAILGLAASAGACGSTEVPRTEDPPGTVRVSATTLRPGAAASSRADPDGPVTHMGRTVLSQCDRIVLARVLAVHTVGAGAEAVRIEEEERLRGPEEPGTYTVLCGEVGLSPRPPGRALFLLRTLPHGGQATLEVAPLDDDAGPPRLAAFRRYLGIEAIADAALRRDALLVYLRDALRADDAWTRANAVREYSAFAEAFPRGLGRADGAALSAVLPGIREPELRALAQRALDAVPATGPRADARPKASDPAEDRLAGFEKRFAAPGAGADARRDAVLDAAAALERGAERLVARGLADADAGVREASAASAGEVGLTSQAPRLLTLAATDADPDVRRTCVIALGQLRATGAVETLAGLARSDTTTARVALFALARIRDDASRSHLEALGEEFRSRATAGDGEEAAESARLVDFLLSDAFVRQERALGARWADRP